MGSKKTLVPYNLFTSATMSGTTTITSPATDVRNLDDLNMFILWTGNAVGTFSVLVSDNNIDYVPLTINPPLTNPNNNAQGISLFMALVPFFFIKLQYTNISGTGTLTARISGKDIN